MVGYFAAFTCTVFVTAKDLVSKKIAFNTSGTLSAFASFAFAIPYYLVLLAVLYALGFEDFSYSPKFMAFVLLRSLSDVGAEWLKMSSLRYGEISLIGQFLALTPLFLTITSPLITGDPISLKVGCALLLVTLSSIFLLAKSSTKTVLTADTKKGIRLALGSAFFFSLNSAFDRVAAQEASATMSAFMMTLLSGLFLLPVAFYKHRSETTRLLAKNKDKFFLRGFFEVFFMVFKMIALKYLQAPVVIVLQRFSLLFTIIGGHFLYKEGDVRKRLIAGSLVVVSGILVLI